MSISISIYDISKSGRTGAIDPSFTYESDMLPREGEEVGIMLGGGAIQFWLVKFVRHGVHTVITRQTTGELWCVPIDIHGTPRYTLTNNNADFRPTMKDPAIAGTMTLLSGQQVHYEHSQGEVDMLTAYSAKTEERRVHNEALEEAAAEIEHSFMGASEIASRIRGLRR